MKTKIISLAQAQVGNDHTTYCKAFGFTYRIEWCACFISWLAKQTGTDNIIPVSMSCTQQVNTFKKLGVWHERGETPQVGDILYYDWNPSAKDGVDHVGVVESVNGNSITVIEGNKNDTVARRVIDKNYSMIYGFARPNYPVDQIADNGTYTVVKGDTLSAIANRYNCTVLDLTLLNGITNPNIINVGQIIKLPSKATAPVDTHIVAKGDTLWDIANRYNTTASKLIAINNIANPGLINVGQVIKLPNKATAQVTPTNPYSKPSANIRYDDRGDGVKWLQWLLVQKGYSVGSSGIDGIFGSGTLTAVKKFQKDVSLTADGIVGPLTKAKL